MFKDYKNMTAEAQRLKVKAECAPDQKKQREVTIMYVAFKGSL